MLDLIASLAAATLVVNEVLYDPPGPDTGREFVELYNPDSVSVSLAGWRLEFGDGARPGRWTPVWEGAGSVLPAGGLWLVAGDSLAGRDADLRGVLQNGPDALRLVAPWGPVDVLGWGALAAPEYYETRPAADVSGRSLARLPDGNDTQDNAADFAAAVPSPGRRNLPQRNLALRLETLDPARLWPGRAIHWTLWVHNRGRQPVGVDAAAVTAVVTAREGAPAVGEPLTWELPLPATRLAPGDSVRARARWLARLGAFAVQAHLAGADEVPEDDAVAWRFRVGPGSILVDEILFAPRPGEPEWIELWNRSAGPVDLRGWTLADDADRGVPLRAARALGAGAYAIVSGDTLEDALDRAPPGALRVLVRPWPALNNTDREALGYADRLILRNARGDVEDAVFYRASWAPVKGRSIERLTDDPDVRGLLWAVCKDPAGSTPGRVNSARRPARVHAALRLAPNPFSPDGDGRDDHLRIDFEVPSGFVGWSGRVHDLRGRRRAQLGGDRLGSGPRSLVWEGLDSQGSLLPAGAYILDLMFFDKSGGQRRLRRVVGLVR